PQTHITGPASGEFGAWFITPDKPEDAALSKGKLLRRPFDVSGNVSQAILYATALGLYEPFINGSRVRDALLTPGWTEYRSRLLYQTWDVTELIREGENALGAMLGAGWYKGDLAGWTGQRNVYGEKTALLMRLDIHYADGSCQTVSTDGQWRCSDGPVLFSELYHGEIYDARLEQPGWNEPGFDCGTWLIPERLDYPLENLRPQDGPLVRRREVLPVKEVIITPKGETVLDFGQNMTGWVRFAVKGKAGDKVVLRHAEVLDSEGNFYTENMRGAKNEITYILGGEEAVFEPHFTFQGFRYVMVAECPGQVNPEDYSAVVIHSDMPPAGSFECSNDMLNRLHSNILWGLKGNFVDIPTDCPQRDERLGWTGDAQIFARTSTYMMDTRMFWSKWLRDLRKAQFKNGGVPFVVPDVLTGKFPEGDIIANAESVAGWGDAAVICPWAVWLAYGDKAVLSESYDSMKAWVEYIHGRADRGLLWNNDYQLGDWVALDAKEGSYFGATATDLIATAYYAKCAEILAKSAAVLEKEDDAEFYAKLREEIGEAYVNEFFTKNGRLASPTQTAHILSLAFGLTPPEYKERTIKGLLALLKENDGHLTTGFLGTPYFCQVLADSGHLDEAYALLLKEDYPSWLYQITKGATTVWEHWDGMKPDGSMWSPNMNSFNHYAYGSIGEFLYRVIGGVDTDGESTGYKKIIIKPRPGGGLTWAKASVETPYGKLAVHWRLEGPVFKLEVKIPPNASARVIMPDGSEYEALSGNGEYLCGV
ncbi:MAG: glycoside hydrolase family 78 protein, partial [Clostridiales bacterium]|nr:glycoside hydrolase family 78 protein [Clostridiales bacterium]